MNVDDVVQERIAAARRKIAADKKRREELAEARRHGIAARHRQKLARLAQYSPGTRETPADDNTPTTQTSQQPARVRGTGHEPAAHRRAGMHGNGEIDE
ncbi:hypothetical protein [Streptomyces parvus]|uniref:hypothetical protein n=1 Tax=Streptomyces parvus TaxID=66428 RepID=UPI003316FEDA